MLCANQVGRRRSRGAAGAGRVVAAAAAAALLLAAGAARAAPTCRNLGVSRPLAFGSYDPFSGATVAGTAVVTYDCPPPAAPAISFSAGSSGNAADRAMNGPLGDRLRYNLYTDAGCRSVWGEVPVPVPDGNNRSITVYGCLPGGQVVASGIYSDTIWVVIDF